VRGFLDFLDFRKEREGGTEAVRQIELKSHRRRRTSLRPGASA